MITAVVGSAVVGAGVGLISSKRASDAQQKGYETSANVSLINTDRMIKAQQQATAQARADLSPWRKAGSDAMKRVSDQIAKGPGDFVPEEQPGYKFGYEEFLEKPTLRAAAATGNLGGGGTLRALSRYAQDYASTQYDNWLNRYYQSLNPDLALAGMGQNAAAMTGNQGLVSAGQIGNALSQNTQVMGQSAIGSGNAQANNYINNANTITGAMNTGLSNWILLRQLNGGNLTGGIAQYPANQYNPS
jgi:hypothetical protein